MGTVLRVPPRSPAEEPRNSQEGRGLLTWNSRTGCSSASIAALSFSSPPANNFSSTTNNSRTSPSAASPAKLNALLLSARLLQTLIRKWRRARAARIAAKKRPSLLSQHRGVRCSVANASSSAAPLAQPLKNKTRIARILQIGVHVCTE